MGKAWFVWRHNSKGYDPAIYYDELPEPREPSIGPRIATTHDVSHLRKDINYELSYSFNQLQEMYPAPIDQIGEKINLNIDTGRSSDNNE